ncbi:MAG: hypothetical protein ACI8RZ_001027 [Myxococcota bacterium]|jgi:hypothetical protein
MNRHDPLYRKVNTRTRGVHHHTGLDFTHRRNTKNPGNEAAMHAGKRRGLDYTPLFRFLLSRIGEDWDAVFAQAAPRLDRVAPIYWLVARQPHEQRATVRVGESTYYSGLYINDDRQLAVVDPTVTPETLEPSCACCTHTLNGVRLTRPPRH